MTWMEDLLTFVLHVSGVEHSPQRRKLNFVGAQLTDDASNEWTNVYIGNTNDWKGSVRVATTQDMSATRTGNILTASGNGNINTLGGIDSATVAIDDLVLFKDEAAGADNGIYRLTDLGSVTTPWTAQRATLADESVEVTPGLTTYVEEGTVNARTVYRLVTINIVLNTTALVFESMSVVPGIRIDDTDSPYAVNLGQRVILADTTVGVVRVDLPPAADWAYSEIQVKDRGNNAAANWISIYASPGETIDGISPFNIAINRKSVVMYSDGTDIHVMNKWS